jgi:hypothetical protein
LAGAGFDRSPASPTLPEGLVRNRAPHLCCSAHWRAQRQAERAQRQAENVLRRVAMAGNLQAI